MNEECFKKILKKKKKRKEIIGERVERGGN